MKEEQLEGNVSKLSEAIPVGSKTQNLYVGQCYLKRLGRPERVEINRQHAQAYFKGTRRDNESDAMITMMRMMMERKKTCSTFSPGSHETCRIRKDMIKKWFGLIDVYG